MPESNRRNFAAISQLVLGAYWLTFFVLTHLPAGTQILPPRYWDKAGHMIGYALLAGLLALTWQLCAENLTGRHLWWVWVFVLIYGVFDELTQIPVGRSASVWDWLADAVGAGIGLLLFVWLRRRFAARASGQGSVDSSLRSE